MQIVAISRKNLGCGPDIEPAAVQLFLLAAGSLETGGCEFDHRRSVRCNSQSLIRDGRNLSNQCSATRTCEK